MTVQVNKIEKRRGRPRKKEPKEKVTMMMHPGLRERLRDLAETDGLGYQSLAHQMLADSVARRSTYQAAGASQRLALLAHDIFQLVEDAEHEIGNVEDAEWTEALEGLKQTAAILRSRYGDND
jgi:hypothetical protein